MSNQILMNATPLSCLFRRRKQMTSTGFTRIADVVLFTISVILLTNPATASLRALVGSTEKVDKGQFTDSKTVLGLLPLVDPIDCQIEPNLYGIKQEEQWCQIYSNQLYFWLDQDFRPNRSLGTFVTNEDEIYLTFPNGGNFVFWEQREGDGFTWSHAVFDMSIWKTDKDTNIITTVKSSTTGPYTWNFVDPRSKSNYSQLDQPKRLEGDHAVFVSAWFAEYQHMLIDRLGYLIYMSTTLPASTKILLPRVQEDQMFDDILQSIDPDLAKRVEYLNCDNYLTCSNQLIEVRNGSLKVLSPKSPTQHLELFELVRSWIWNSDVIKKKVLNSKKKKIVIYYKRNRVDANNGRCMDESQETQIIQRIEHYLERYGRDEKLVVFDGRLSIFEQIKLFASATVVIGPHGGGLANILLMAPPEDRAFGSCAQRPKVLEFVTNSRTPNVQGGYTMGATYFTLYATCPWVELHQIFFMPRSNAEVTYIDMNALEDSLKYIFSASQLAES